MSCLFAGPAFYICMALSGVTYSPPPPSATIEAIEAIETHAEDREGKPVLPLPPLSTYYQGVLLLRSSTTYKFVHTGASTTTLTSNISQDGFDDMASTLLCSTSDLNRNQTDWIFI